MELLYLLAGVVVGVALCAVWCAMRLRGERTMTEALREVVPFLAGPRPRVPR
jgi:hypothetical protein